MLLLLGRLRTKAFPKVIAIIESIYRSPFGDSHCNDIVNTKWVVSKLDLWEHKLAKLKVDWSLPRLVGAALQVCIDVDSSCIRDKNRGLLNDVFKPLNELSDFFDPKGEKVERFEYIDMLLSEMYSLVGYEA